MEEEYMEEEIVDDEWMIEDKKYQSLSIKH